MAETAQRLDEPSAFENHPDIHAEMMAALKYRYAVDHRRFAHRMRRWGNPGLFHEWMRKALRDWREYKYYMRRLAR